MGKQRGALKIQGTLGDITFAKGKNGYVVKEKSEIPADMLATGRQFKKLRDQQAVFGRGGRACNLVRRAFQEQINVAKDFRTSQRLQQVMLQVIATDPIHRRGEKDVPSGNLRLLEEFEFNGDAKWRNSISVEYTPSIDRAAGMAGISLPGYIPEQRVTPPAGSDHYRIVCAVAEIDFALETLRADVTVTGLTPIDFTPQAPLNLTASFTAGTDLPVFLVLGIQFSEVENGFEELDVHGRFNALTIVRVDQL